MTFRKEWLLSRRQLLGGISAAGAAALLPVRFVTAQSSIPKRLIIVHVPEGMWPGAPRGSGTDLGPMLDPLSPFANYVNVVNGLDMVSMYKGPGGDGHRRGPPHMLTGTEQRDQNNAGGASVDQHIARHIRGNTPFPSVQLGLGLLSPTLTSGLVWAGAGDRLPPTQSPWDAYNRLFRNLPDPSSNEPPPFDLRTSVLDHSLGEVETLRSRLGSADRERLDTYRRSLRELEDRLARLGSVDRTCEPPSLGPEMGLRSNDNFPAIGQLHMDVIVKAMQCDLTRVATLQYGGSVDRCTYPWLGVNEWGHDIAHSRKNDKKQRVYNWYAKQFAYLLDALSNVQEVDGSTMLDHTVVLWASEFGDSARHSGNNLMWILMGNVDGYFTSGRVHNVSGRSHNDLLTTLCQAFGMSDQTYGNPRYNEGPLDNLRA